jgi:hypothetical protein
MDKFLTALPWPLCVAAVAVFAIWLFKKEIRGVINRVRSGGHKDTKITLDPSIEQQMVLTDAPPPKGLIKRAEESAPAGNEISENGAKLKAQNSTISGEVLVTRQMNEERARALRTVGISPVVTNREELIRKDMSNILDTTERETLLVRNLAIAQLQWSAERLYRVIFGSQLDLLQHLNLFGPTRTEALIERFHKPAVARYPQLFEHYSSESYKAFLTANELIANHQDGKCTITVIGKEFLAWISHNGVPMDKPG